MNPVDLTGLIYAVLGSGLAMIGTMLGIARYVGKLHATTTERIAIVEISSKAMAEDIHELKPKVNDILSAQERLAAGDARMTKLDAEVLRLRDQMHETQTHLANLRADVFAWRAGAPQ